MNRNQIVYGVFGAVAAATAAGAAAAGVVVQKRRRSGQTFPRPSFDDLHPDRTRTIHTDDGVALYVEEVGPADAPLTVVFSHGFALSLRSFFFQRRAVQEKFGDTVRLVFYDQRGHGRSGPSVPQGATIDQLGRDLLQVIDMVVPDGPLVLVGHSMGGMTALALALQQPQLFTVPTGPRSGAPRIAGLALVCTSAGGLAGVSLGLPALVTRLRGPLAPILLRTARRRAALVEHGRRIGGDLAWVITRRFSFGASDISPDVVDFLHEIISGTRIEVIADFYPALMSYDVSAAVPGLADCDGVVISGQLDRLTPAEHGRRIAEQWPPAEYIELGGCGHAAVLEQPDVVDAALVDLIDRVTQARVSRR
ncbi:MAG: alpha/beta hydrolase [Actinomycetota bacterium]|nr:alpha/beta hydrolase [Actinomycetota bacterium]